MSSITVRFGNSMPNASRSPNSPPEAPTVGYGEPISQVTSNCATAALSTLAV